MKLYNFKVTHQNQSQTHGEKEIGPLGAGPVDIQVHCHCGVTHKLIGSVKNSGSIGGSGHGSVVPPNDPDSTPSPKVEDEPSWSGSPGNFPG